ncbi:unnamed protein product, partial [Prorocentrum cordatum]
ESSASLFCPEVDTPPPSTTGSRSPPGTAEGADGAPAAAAPGDSRRSLFDCAEDADATGPARAGGNDARLPDGEVHGVAHSASLPASEMKKLFEEK